MSALHGDGLWLAAWRRLLARRSQRLALGVLALLLLAAILVPMLSPRDYAAPVWQHILEAPSLASGSLLGTDGLGRDLLVRVMWGMRVSLLVGLAASVISVLIGVSWGTTAGYVGGRTDALMMRVVDVLYSVPFIPLVIVLSVVFGRHFLLVFAAIGAVSWLDIARIVRGQTLAISQREFIEAARALGLPGPTLLWRHLVPNLAGIVVVYATLTVPSVILFEALLSFLGLGVQAPLASLGSLVADGAVEMQAHPYLLIWPASLLAVLILCLNHLGDGLRDALDPRHR
jgi:oligopeptide transport system permease protein